MEEEDANDINDIDVNGIDINGIDINDQKLDDDQLYEVNVDGNEVNDVIGKPMNTKKNNTKRPFSDELFAKYLQQMWDEIDSADLGFQWPSEGTAPRSTFRFFDSDLIRSQQEEVITYVDPDELGFALPSEGTIPRDTYLKQVDIEDNEEDLDDYNDESIVASPIRDTVGTKIVIISKDMELKDRNVKG